MRPISLKRCGITGYLLNGVRNFTRSTSCLSRVRCGISCSLIRPTRPLESYNNKNHRRNKITTLINTLDIRWYPDTVDRWDDSIFRQKILAVITPKSQVLDLGAGAGIIDLMNFRGQVHRVCGIDLDERVLDNSYLDEAKVANCEEIPFPDSTFDVVFSDNVLEHLDNPAVVFSEVSRVLKPGGIFLFKTPNRYHYMPVIAQITPHCFHEYISRLRGRDNTDTFPTRYRANSTKKIKKLANKAGFQVKNIDLIEGRPEYLRLNAITYFIGFCYERIVNNVPFLRHFRIFLIGHLFIENYSDRPVKTSPQQLDT